MNGYTRPISVGIVGGTGYGAGELLRLLTQHPEAEVVSVVSSSSAGAPLIDAHPHLSGFYDLRFDAQLNFKRLGEAAKSVVFLALPHGASAAVAKQLLPEIDRLGALLIDLSGDFRLSEDAARRRFYPDAQASPELQRRFVYGLSEINRAAIADACCIATPGCLAAVCILGAAPLMLSRTNSVPFAEEPFSGSVVFDVKTGTSGGGKGLSEVFHHPTRHGNSTPYKVLQHRHEPEVLQALGDPSGERIRSSFVPHLIPTSRGCSATIHLELDEATTTEQLTERYRSFYEGHPFVRLRSRPPEWQTVIGTNFCDISVVARKRQVVAMSAIDNLVKGTAGQAIQNMNLACGLPEATGLWAPALGPSTLAG